jgi:dsDNA-specific endonuclease/ATPase MutS2
MSFLDWLRGRKESAAEDKRSPARSVFDEEEEEDVDLFDPFPEPVRLEILDVFDLHAVAPRDVKVVVEAYLAEARAAGYRSVRLIHGKGVGVQRQMVRKILARTPFVEAWSDAPPEAGGWGATVAHFAPENEEGADN